MIVAPPLPNLPHVNFSEDNSPVMGTLIDLIKVDPKLAANFLEQLNISKISPQSSTADSNPDKQGQIDPTKLSFDLVHGVKDSTPIKDDLYKILWTTLAGQPLSATNPLTPD